MKQPTAPLAQVRGLEKRYGPILALSGVDLEVRAGEVLGLLGPNGAGKTTLVKLLAGLLTPDAGEVRLLGGDPRDWRSRLELGLTPQETGFPENLRVKEIVELVAAHYADPEPVPRLLSRFGLEDRANRPARALSGGERRRLAVLLAFVGRPRLTLLDEPTTGLDVGSRRRLWEEIRAFREGGGGVLLTSHYLEEIEVLADRVVILHEGRVLEEGSVDTIRTRVGLKKVRFKSETIPRISGVTKAGREGPWVTLYTADADRVVAALVRSGHPFEGLEVQPVKLEEAFLLLTEREPA